MLSPILMAPVLVQIHVACAVMAIVLAPVQLLRLGRGRAHKVVGYAWVSAMALTALTSFGILEFRVLGPFSPIHLLSVLVLYSLVSAIMAARRGQIARHSAILRSLSFWSLAVAGLFTLIPGRVLNAVLFSGWEVAGFLASACVILALAFVIRQRGAVA